MAITNHERIGKCLEQLSAGLQPFVERELKSSYQDNWFAETRKTLSATKVDFLGTADKPEGTSQVCCRHPQQAKEASQARSGPHRPRNRRASTAV